VRLFDVHIIDNAGHGLLVDDQDDPATPDLDGDPDASARRGARAGCASRLSTILPQRADDGTAYNRRVTALQYCHFLSANR